MYASNRHKDIHYRSLPEIHFTASGFFLKTFDCLCVFVFVSFWSFFFFFFCESTHYEKQKKQQHKNNNNLNDLQTGRTNTLLSRSSSDYHVKESAKSMCYQKNLHQSVPYTQNESCLAYKETENG